MNYYFSNLSQPLDIQITETSEDISDLELELIKGFASFENVDSSSIWNVDGRSIFFHSPTKKHSFERELKGDYSSIQLIGSGGNLDKVTGEMIQAPRFSTQTLISPVDSCNVNHVIGNVGCLASLNLEGEFEFKTRDYMPKHGMDKKEAMSRRKNSQMMLERIEDHLLNNSTSGIQVPRFLFGGIYPNLLDPDKEPLHFQAYRVPTLERFPNQFLQMIKGGINSEARIQLFGQLVGDCLKDLHDLGIAYLDCHGGNFSLLENEGRLALYATDLGSFGEIPINNPFSNRYKTFDIFMFLYSVSDFFQGIDSFFKTPNYSFHDDFMPHLYLGFHSGYFKSEITKDKVKMFRLCERKSNFDEFVKLDEILLE